MIYSAAKSRFDLRFMMAAGREEQTSAIIIEWEGERQK